MLIFLDLHFLNDILFFGELTIIYKCTTLFPR